MILFKDKKGDKSVSKKPKGVFALFAKDTDLTDSIFDWVKEDYRNGFAFHYPEVVGMMQKHVAAYNGLKNPDTGVSYNFMRPENVPDNVLEQLNTIYNNLSAAIMYCKSAPGVDFLTKPKGKSLLDQSLDIVYTMREGITASKYFNTVVPISNGTHKIADVRAKDIFNNANGVEGYQVILVGFKYSDN